MLQDLAYTIVYVDDMDESVKFYRDALGMQVDYQTNGWTQFKSNGTALVLHPKLAETPPAARQPAEPGITQANGRVHVTFQVDDMDGVYRQLSERGVHFVAPPAKAAFGRHATLLDPEGNAIDLIQWETKRTASGVSASTTVNDILARAPEAMEVLEDHGIRICGGCIVLLNGSVRETAEYSGLSSTEMNQLIEELDKKVQ